MPPEAQSKSDHSNSAEIRRLRYALEVVTANTQPGMTAHEVAMAALNGTPASDEERR